MTSQITFSAKYDKEALAACDTGFIREMIAQNSKKIEQHLKELEELKNRMINDKSSKAIA